MEDIHTALPNAFARIMGLEGPPQDMEASEVWAGWYLVKAREIYPFSDIPDTMDHLLATLAAVRMEDPLAVMDMKERAQRDIKHLQEALRTQDQATWVESWMERFPEIATPGIFPACQQARTKHIQPRGRRD